MHILLTTYLNEVSVGHSLRAKSHYEIALSTPKSSLIFSAASCVACVTTVCPHSQCLHSFMLFSITGINFLSRTQH